MKKYILLPVFLFVCLFAVIAAAQSVNTVKGKHAENGLKCEDCHGTVAPEKKASSKACIECHGQVPGEVKEYHDGGKPLKVNPHESHQGEIRCTLCHSSHGESKLYCVECHNFEDMKVK